MLCNQFNNMTTSSFGQVTKFLPEDGAVYAEVCRKDFINNNTCIHIELYVCIFLCITDIIPSKIFF